MACVTSIAWSGSSEVPPMAAGKNAILVAKRMETNQRAQFIRERTAATSSAVMPDRSTTARIVAAPEVNAGTKKNLHKPTRTLQATNPAASLTGEGRHAELRDSLLFVCGAEYGFCCI
ncbi:hypothetical protein GCM10027188_29560 [Lysobacter humi (ex Lee et al. 2017)]